MTYQLTNQEKSNIVSSRLKNLETIKYDLELSISEESAVVSPNQDFLLECESRLNDVLLKKEHLESILSQLS